MTLGQMLKSADVTHEKIEEHLNGLFHEERIRQVTALNKTHQARLWEAAGSVNKPFDLSFLVPEDAAEFAPHPFEGRNSLPAFTRFRKVFYKTPDGEIAGYNNQSIEKITGPGYFIAETTPDGPGPVMINYLRIPREKPAGWPDIRPNEAGLSRFIYAGANDFLRYVSPHVVIGRVYRRRGDAAKPTHNYFVLCRATE